MPDWLTYVLSAWVACEVAHHLGLKDARRYVGVAVAGSVLPDLVKVTYILKGYAHIDLVAFTIPLATPIGVLLLVGLVSTFFPPGEMRRVFGYMFMASAIHIVWDLMIHPLGGGQLMIFPLSFKQYSLGLFWPDSILPLLLAGSAALILTLCRFRSERTAGGRIAGM